MPLRRLTGRERSEAANWQLASLLVFTAGAVDVSGYLAFRQFTSHVSGLVAGMAAEISLRDPHILLGPALVFACFLCGAAVCAILINAARRRNRESLYAVPVLLEAVLLALIAFAGSPTRFYATLAVLSFSMGLQNATITKISHAEIRTTHVTGMITDIGIELGKALYWNRTTGRAPVHAERRHLLLLLLLVSLFFAGGVFSALAYPHFGFRLILPLAALLALLTVFPIAADVRQHHTV